MALPKGALEDQGRDPSSAVHRLAAVYIPPNAAVGIFDALHFTTTPWHFHDFYELAIVKSGTAYHVSDRGIERVERGTVIFVPPGVGHEYRLCEDIRVYNCLFRADLADGELMWAFRDDHLRVLFDPLPRPGNKRGDEIVNVQLDEAGTENVSRRARADRPRCAGGAHSRGAGRAPVACTRRGCDSGTCRRRSRRVACRSRPPSRRRWH